MRISLSSVDNRPQIWYSEGMRSPLKAQLNKHSVEPCHLPRGVQPRWQWWSQQGSTECSIEGHAMKYCPRCKEVKLRDEFSKNRTSTDGLQAWCKECQSQAARGRYAKDPKKYLEYMRRYRKEHPEVCRGCDRRRHAKNPEKFCARARHYRERNGEKYRESIRCYRAQNPGRVKAQNRFGYAIERGKIVRPDVCSACGKVCKPDGHHEDYSKPLEVMWLCRSCHKRLHQEAQENRALGSREEEGVA